MQNRILSRSLLSLPVVVGIAALSAPGCSREQYREHADTESYSLLDASTESTPWPSPQGFTIEPDPRSRFYDPSDPDDPALPQPGPHLYSYSLPALLARPTARARSTADAAATDDDRAIVGLPIQPIPKSYWETIPPRCLARMLEFLSVRGEYRDEYEADPPPEMLDSSQRLSFGEIVELAILSSRELQSQKEALFSAALAVTIERFDYSMRFSSTGNGVDPTYTHNRSDGETVQSAAAGSSLGFERMLATGGTLLARFANTIVFTFDGPDGWASDVSSELVFSLEESLTQRDIRLESLTQSERSLVYAARDFARFRREFFVDLAAVYYDLLRTFRSIEIESQNYFSLVRTYEQARAEEVRGVKGAPNPVAVDQFEQSMLSGRSSLISTCNRLEGSLDSLKIVIGIPTETRINIELGELDELTLRDEVEVAAERVRRWRSLLLSRRNRSNPDRGDVLNGKIFLIERILYWLKLRSRLGSSPPETKELENLLLRFRVDAARVEVTRIQAVLTRANDPNAGSPIVLRYGRTTHLITVTLELARQQSSLARQLGRDQENLDALDARIDALEKRLTEELERLDAVLKDEEEGELGQLVTDATSLLQEVQALVAETDTLLALDPEPADAAERLAKTLEQSDALVERTNSLLTAAGLGLPPVGIVEDDAMRTALVQRFDLMNRRGQLADTWRRIKHAADELRTAVNLGADYSIRTREDEAFEFTTDESRGAAKISIDLPLNRRAKRNNYRRALIDYQAGRRGLMALEDAIKRDIRSALRGIAERRIQYPISVTQAALAAEQVISIKLQLSLGVPGVRGTDLLDAQERSRNALISVANERIGYIVDRANLVLGLERMELDENGAWTPIDDPEYRPTPDTIYPEGAGPTYGDLPSFLQLSDEIQRLLDHPLPGAQIETEQVAPEGEAARAQADAE